MVSTILFPVECGVSFLASCGLAFLLNNGLQYHIAHIIGLAEYFITALLVDDNAASRGGIFAFRKWWNSHGSLFGKSFPYPYTILANPFV
jgi:hypothetical protein